MQRSVLAEWTMPNSSFGNGIGRANICANGVFAVHADLHGRLNAAGAFDIIDVDHRFLPIGFAFRAGHFAGFAADTALHVHKKFQVIIHLRRAFLSSRRWHKPWIHWRAAQILPVVEGNMHRP
jgi:hypothetical protein